MELLGFSKRFSGSRPLDKRGIALIGSQGGDLDGEGDLEGERRAIRWGCAHADETVVFGGLICVGKAPIKFYFFALLDLNLVPHELKFDCK